MHSPPKSGEVTGFDKTNVFLKIIQGSNREEINIIHFLSYRYCQLSREAIIPRRQLFLLTPLYFP